MFLHLTFDTERSNNYFKGLLANRGSSNHIQRDAAFINHHVLFPSGFSLLMKDEMKMNVVCHLCCCMLHAAICTHTQCTHVILFLIFSLDKALID